MPFYEKHCQQRKNKEKEKEEGANKYKIVATNVIVRCLIVSAPTAAISIFYLAHQEIQLLLGVNNKMHHLGCKKVSK